MQSDCAVRLLSSIAARFTGHVTGAATHEMGIKRSCNLWKMRDALLTVL
jgi:hypothetical protein